jgi:acetyltransferase-like isoleucine patch superfamily enzyme
MSRIRIYIFRLIGITIGKKNRFESGQIRRVSQIELGDYNALSMGWCLWPGEEDGYDKKIRIGSYNYFNRNLMIDACKQITIGDHNMFGPDVYITDSNHQFSLGEYPSSLPMDKGTVNIGNGCWIGAKVCILKDVTLGDHCVVAAGAVVTKSFPAGSLIGGVPAKLLRRI